MLDGPLNKQNLLPKDQRRRAKRGEKFRPLSNSLTNIVKYSWVRKHVNIHAGRRFPSKKFLNVQ